MIGPSANDMENGRFAETMEMEHKDCRCLCLNISKASNEEAIFSWDNLA